MIQFYCHTFLSWKYPCNLNLTIISFSYHLLVKLLNFSLVPGMKFLFLLLLGIMEQREFLSKIQLPLFLTNARVWLFLATIILTETWKEQIKPTTKQTSECISVLPILRRIWENWNYMYNNMYLGIFPCWIHSDCFFIISCKRFNWIQIKWLLFKIFWSLLYKSGFISI